ncbi:MAG: PIG-L family deacetylase [Burkholderiaceae bacterium]|nr:PIG-L family deacetylase [Burkholderiaceae bacterium]
MNTLPMSPAQLGRMMVISPHLDDAVFGCGELLAAAPGTVVATVFAGTPAQTIAQTSWDTSCGFNDSSCAMQARRHEDWTALTSLCATPIWLNFCDSQYGQTPSMSQIGCVLLELLAYWQVDTFLIPIGLWHSDHILAHRAALAAWKDNPGLRCLAYEDSLYRRIGNSLQLRLAEMLCKGIGATPIDIPTGNRAAIKKQAVQCYASQLRGLSTPRRPSDTDLMAPERYWKLGCTDA